MVPLRLADERQWPSGKQCLTQTAKVTEKKIDHQGPVSTYMALCTGGCATFQANTALWFKIDASGYDPTTKLWAADNLRASRCSLIEWVLSNIEEQVKDNNSWTSTIPASLAPGQYVSFSM